MGPEPVKGNLEGKKFDQGKIKWELLPGDAMEEVAKVLTFGASKYGDRNWEKGMAWSRPFGASMRHLWAWFRGEDKDPETGLSHLAHAACCVLFLLAYVLRNTAGDDRPKVVPYVTVQATPLSNEWSSHNPPGLVSAVLSQPG